MVKKIVMVVLMPTTLLANAYAASIQDSLRTTIYFRPGYSLLELSYRDNAANMKALTQGIQTIKGNPCVQLQHIRILSAASPEGNSALNKRVAKRRGERLRDYLKETLVLPDSIFTVSSAGEDWQGLASLIAKEKTPWRNKALQIIRHTPEWITRNGKVVDGRKRQLQNLDGGKAWKYMLDNHFYTLRTGAVVVCEVKTLAAESTPSAAEARLEQARSEQARLESASQQSASQSPSSPPFPAIPSQVHPSSESQAPPVASYFALKSNLLYDALLVPNLSLEASIGSGWTLGAGGMLAWWSKDAKHRYWRIYGGDLEIRKYFGTLSKSKPLQGHHLGIYGDFLTYDFEFGAKGYQSKATYAAGIKYGYSHPIANRLNLDFALGIGYLHSNYKTYVPRDGCYVYQETKKQKWLGPTQAEISLVWLLGKGNTNKKKGGKK
ncbi:DUF3575 domain-containing protein [Segatella copri]|uniref:DUF3575 domain-containing protein n=1 Tax=Segatella copri TaxID=165179 RepID=UPI0019329FFC|nr:DUF3575 domain-containing protein [Segatella copri]MBM0128392.1 DUF3575 domain-containing protein [Segatella copri]